MDRRGEEALRILREPGVLTDDLRRELLELLVFPPERRRMTYEEFLEWADEDTLAEWVDGEVVTYSPASDRHQDIADFLVSILRPFVESRQLGVIRSAPFQMKLSRSGREPDLLFVSREHLDRLKKTYLDGPADLVVEIISPESIGRDRGEKFWEYQEAGIPEYWL
ncbi:MAG: Uma2 family endonuclease, partial [Chloroflexi bacterium]